jgi:hypothetical protein
MNRSVIVAGLLLAAAASAACAARRQTASTATIQSKEPVMSFQPPSSSRPAPPKVEPITHDGVRYEQDMQSARYGGTQPGGYLVAIDPATGNRLWMLKVYEVPVQADAPFQPGRYFRSMRLGPDGDRLEIESEAGGKYVVDLANRTSTWISGPDSVHQKQIKP